MIVKPAWISLIFELRAMGIPVTEFTPSRGQDKIARVNAVSGASGLSGTSTRWAEEVIEEALRSQRKASTWWTPQLSSVSSDGAAGSGCYG